MKRMRGSVSFEAVLALNFILIPAMALLAESSRVRLQRLVLHASAFHYVRQRALGSDNRESISATKVFRPLLGRAERRQASQTHHWESGQYPSSREVWGRVRVRVHSFFPELQPRFQVTERCRFSW